MSIAIYGFNPFYTGGQPVIDDLKSSGFTTVIQASVLVNPQGDLFFDGHGIKNKIIVTNGQYTGDPEWPGYLADLKEGCTKVKRLLFSLATGDSEFKGTFRNIKSLVDSPGPEKNNILYKNLKALKDAIPAIDGIDLDYEGEEKGKYDPTAIIKFSPMLHTLGYQVTFCPFEKPDFWVNCLHALHKETPGLVTGFHTQNYDCNFPNPEIWINAIQKKMGPCFDAAGFVFPGLRCRGGSDCSIGLCPDDITTEFAHWKKEDGIQGGFIWLYDDIQRCSAYNVKEGNEICSGSMDAKAYADATRKGLE